MGAYLNSQLGSASERSERSEAMAVLWSTSTSGRHKRGLSARHHAVEFLAQILGLEGLLNVTGNSVSNQ